MASLTEELSEWASSLRLGDIPDRVVSLAKSQILSQLAAIRAGMAHPLGASLVRAFGPPLQADPARSACILAGLGSWLNLDDTAYAGHLSNSTVSVPLAFAYARHLDGADLLTAVIAANECAARITASATLGPFRGQTAPQTSLAGAVSGRLQAENAPARQWVDAFGLAFSMPPWTLFHAFLGSDARVLSAFIPVRIGMDACDSARAGLAGPSDIFEHADGFLSRFASVPLPETIVNGLGRRWHTETLSFKVRPGGPGIDAAVDCAIEINQQIGNVAPDDVAEILVDASFYTTYASRISGSYTGAAVPVTSTLPLSVPYTVATALIRGDLAVSDFARPAIDDAARWALASKVRLSHSPEMTRKLLASDAPLGEALRQAGERATGWLSQFGGSALVDAFEAAAPPVATFEAATKQTAARVTVRFADGRSISRERDIPIGAAGPDTRVHHHQLVRKKFLANGGGADIAAACADLDQLNSAQVRSLLQDALSPPSTTASQAGLSMA
ncbi:MmgE/PrpD family protein [Phytohabitans houttuyneae]|uniref:2-methylcitrate dehydratase n=1 Tax=Phytohabitans houttuyneae TaxID=1076126 RepID=A0A6V8KG08_9ACTN|nr:MmgE/PrpD family protein [Phytohabitans houttuyneae]GFJ81421.1 2-methylcitrate dehydratase [Phytohabitans houttuyneae]